MEFIGQDDIVIRAFFVVLSIMLFASIYLLLSKAVSLACRAFHARRFLSALATTRSLQQLQELVDRQETLKSFARVVHRLIVEKKLFDAASTPSPQESQLHETTAQRLIAHEAAEQAEDLNRGLNVLATTVWAAPLVGLVAVVWRAASLWLQSAPVAWAAGDLWMDGVAVMQLGLVVAVIALLAYLSLRMANRMYLSQFALFRRMMTPMIKPDGNVMMDEATSRRGLPRALQGALGFETSAP